MQEYTQHLISKTGYLFLLAFILLSNCDPDFTLLNPPEPGPTVEEQLLTAYAENSTEDYAGLVTRWHEISIPTITATITDSTLQNVHRVFIEFYDPFHLGKLTPENHSTFWDSIYVETDYIIVDNEIISTVYDTSAFDMYTPLWQCSIVRRDTLDNFRPEVKFENVNILYAYDEYMEAIYNFLGDNTKSENFAECRRQQAFLNSYIRVIWPRWGGWAIRTMPEVQTIGLNNTLDTAIVGWFRWDCGGKAIIKKIDGEWTFIESEMTWMTQ